MHQPTAAANPPPDDAAALARLSEARARLRAEIAKAVVGQDAVLDALLIALLWIYVVWILFFLLVAEILVVNRMPARVKRATYYRPSPHSG